MYYEESYSVKICHIVNREIFSRILTLKEYDLNIMQNLKIML